MRELITVMIYTIKEFITKKSFIVSNLIMFAVIIVMFNVPNIMERTTNNDESKDILIVDSENIFEGSLSTLNTMELGYDFQVLNEEIQTTEINNKINDGELLAGVVLYRANNEINFSYIVQEIGKGMDPEVLQNLFSKIYLNLEVSKLDLTEEQLNNLNMQILYNTKTVDGTDMPHFSFSIVILSIGLFFAIYFCAYQVSAAITMEKTSKVMETLVTSTSPKAIILGKTAGTGIVGIIQLVATIIVGVISYKLFAEGSATIDFLDFSGIKAEHLMISIIYFILGYTLYAFMYALVGSTVSKPEDIQTANSPVAMISLFGFYLGYFSVLFAPTGTATTVASLLPFSSPFNMPFRMMMTNVPIHEILASIAILIITILIIVQISIRIYSRAVLHYGSRMSLKDMFKLYKQK